MNNIDYCKFQNVLSDLYACFTSFGYDHEDIEDGMGDLRISEDEAHARLRLIKLCAKIAEAHKEELV